ncbi:hypothetical protein CEUSTIGMA_g7181.t1 [Chlamydomonas eustigma]|uniref:carnosine N-methyltransferase n=1 Tax=Chlamydomonas eustigma TaxID=1157962 RepID=A0A250XAF4_9CHLO|nr:hypothetical protein CEUSTIGMA_g7181.t1 [Chlamydomonas eustigma]|eukprot:GAX79740.1 hypothetical protein CEUSTIGMA_g7181.t1 [Chlamydomonas eustigma]
MAERRADDSTAASTSRFEEEEREALGRIVHAFQTYAIHSDLQLDRWKFHFSQLPDRHKQILHGQSTKYDRAAHCIKSNQRFFKAMLKAFDDDEGGPSHLAHAADAGYEAAKAQHKITPIDADKVRYVLKNLARDWSSEGAEERQKCYTPILQELKKLLGTDCSSPPAVLLPGAGLGRLCCEVAGLGYQAQGNEFSYHMLLTSSFILNHSHTSHEHVVHPWVLSTCNQLTDEGQLRAVHVPDVPPGDLVAGPGLLSMCAGDFVEVYSADENHHAFDCVVTCFFIDTAHNIVEYVELINHCLKPGGYWVNLGPLLYHWADSTSSEDMSIELSLEEVVRMAASLGFKMIRNELLQAPYMANAQSMFNTSYDAAFWTMVKEADVELSCNQHDHYYGHPADNQCHAQSGHLTSPPPPPPPSIRKPVAGSE